MKISTKTLYTLIFLLVFQTVTAEDVVEDPETRKDTSWTFNFLFENDLFADTDRSYTNGLKVSWISPDLTHYKDSGRIPNWAMPLVNRLPFIHKPGLQRNVAIGLGQKIFTPKDIESRELVRDDRPYAGWLYLSAAFHNKNVRRLDTMEVQVGMVGPWAQGEEAQNFVHGLRGLSKAKGWDNQLENELGFAFIYERKQRGFQAIHDETGLGMDVIGHVGGALGNVFVYANTGAEARFGWNIPTDFGSSLMRPGADSNAPSDSSDPRFSNKNRLGVHGFVAVSGRVVLRDIFLDGNTFASSHSIDKKNFVGDLLVGASVIFGSFKLSYAQVFRSSEFDGQESGHNFGSMNLSYSY